MSMDDFVTGLQHIGIPTNDIDKTVEFYTGLGFTVAHETVNPENGGKVVFLKLKDVMVETYQSDSVCGQPGAVDHVALNCTDVDAAFSLAKERGYQLQSDEVHGLPFWENGVRFFTIIGPNAENVEFCQYL